MGAHLWKMTKEQPSFDRYRRYTCERCGIGPVQKDILSGKASITAEAKRQGFSADCNIEVAKKIHDS